MDHRFDTNLKEIDFRQYQRQIEGSRGLDHRATSGMARLRGACEPEMGPSQRRASRDRGFGAEKTRQPAPDSEFAFSEYYIERMRVG